MPFPSDLPLHDAHAAARRPVRRAPRAAGGRLLRGHRGRVRGRARGRAALVDLPLRSVLEASGPQRQKFLQGMLSHDVAGRQPGQGCLAALMDGEGRGAGSSCGSSSRRTSSSSRRTATGSASCSRTLEHHRVAAPVRFAARPHARCSPSSARAHRAPAERGRRRDPAREPRGSPDRRDRGPPAAPRARGGPAEGRLRPPRGARERGGRVGGPARGGRTPGRATTPSTPCASRRCGRGTGRTSPKGTCSTRRASSPSATRPPRGATSARRWSPASRPAAATSTRPCVGCACRRRPWPARPSASREERSDG